MKVFIKGKVYSSEKEPILVIPTLGERELLYNMGEDKKMLFFEDSHTSEERASKILNNWEALE